MSKLLKLYIGVVTLALLVATWLPALIQTVRAADALVVNVCGTLPLAYPVGSTQQTTIDINGKTCTNAASGISNTAIGYSNSASIAITPIVGGPNIASISPCSAPCNFYGGYVTTGATAGFVMMINAVALPGDATLTIGTATGNIQDCIQVPANASVSLNDKPGPPTRFSVGLTIAFSTTGCAALAHSATALFMKGSVAQ